MHEMIWCSPRKSRTLSQWLAGLISKVWYSLCWIRKDDDLVYESKDPCESVSSVPFSRVHCVTVCQSLSGRSFIIVLQPFYHPHEMEYCGSAGMLFYECTYIFHHAIKHTNQIGFILDTIQICLAVYTSQIERSHHVYFFQWCFFAGTNLALCSFCTVRENSCIIRIFLNFFLNSPPRPVHSGIDFSAKHVSNVTLESAHKAA